MNWIAFFDCLAVLCTIGTIIAVVRAARSPYGIFHWSAVAWDNVGFIAFILISYLFGRLM